MAVEVGLMKKLFLVLALLLCVISSRAERPIRGPIVARVFASFSYGMDVEWLRNPILLKRASVLSIEYNGISRLAHAGPYNVGYDGKYGVIYIFDFNVDDVPDGAVIRVVK
jgi:hypothetical protein